MESPDDNFSITLFVFIQRKLLFYTYYYLFIMKIEFEQIIFIYYFLIFIQRT